MRGVFLGLLERHPVAAVVEVGYALLGTLHRDNAKSQARRMTTAIEDRLHLARELVQAARDEFARAEEAKGGAAVIGLRNACDKGWLATLEATNYYLLMQGVVESELPGNDRRKMYSATRQMNRDMRRDYVEMRQTFYEGIVEFDEMLRHLSELEGYIDNIAAGALNGSGDGNA